MDTLEKQRRAIKKVIQEYADLPRGILRSETIFDDVNSRYLLMVEGWDGIERIHYCVAHLEIIDGKIWIQRDGTEEGIATELEKQGITKKEIVLAFHEPEIRKFTEYAVA
jgi:XisI protein